MTKKAIFPGICAIAISAGIAFAYNANQSTPKNQLIIANIEALSSGEDNSTDLRVVPCTYEPWNECQPDEYYPLECYHKSYC